MGRVELQLSSIPLEPLARDSIRRLEHETRNRSIEWSVGELPVVQGDQAMLRLVFGNLIGNALKYSRNREIAHIEIGAVPGDDGDVVLFVRDDGAGFEMQYAHKLFGVFQRLHRADEFEGTGIGLALVRRIISRHGGKTWAEGAVNQGATFYFSLKPAKTA